MHVPSIVVLTDRRDRGQALANAVRTFALCQVLTVDEPWFCLEPISGIIADLSLDNAQARHSLRALMAKRSGQPLPLIYLAPRPSDAALREALRLGATACFPALTEPCTFISALFRQIAPGKTMTDFLVEHCLARAKSLFADMLEAGRRGPIDLDPAEAAIDPILRALREGGLRRWLDLIQAHDETTVRHCLYVAGLMANFAVHLGLSERDRTAVVRAGLVHDVGKAQIPLAILNKAGPLDSGEMAVMRTHAALGHEILLASGMNDPLALAVTRHHHEMLDGSGYPDGLCGTQIGDPIRLLTICDIYAALTESRPYRPAMPQDEALLILRGMTTDRLEPALVEVFAASLASGQPADAEITLTYRTEQVSQRYDDAHAVCLTPTGEAFYDTAG